MQGLKLINVSKSGLSTYITIDHGQHTYKNKDTSLNNNYDIY